VPGYYTAKFKFKVRSLNTFITAVMRSEICQKFLRKNDHDFAGLAIVFKKFYGRLQSELESEPHLNRNVSENLQQIVDHIMFNLHSEFFPPALPGKHPAKMSREEI